LRVRLHKWPTIWTIRLLGTPRTHSASWALWAECSSRYSRSVNKTVSTAARERKKKAVTFFFFFLIFSEEYLDAALRGEAAAEQPAKQSAQASAQASSTQAQASAQASSKQSASKQSASSTQAQASTKQAQASAQASSKQTDFDSNPESELGFGKHRQAEQVNKMAAQLSKPFDVKRKDVVFVSDVMCAFFAALRSGALLLLLNVLLGPAVSSDGTIGADAVTGFLSLFDNVALTHRDLIDKAYRGGAASVRLLLVFDGVAVNDAKSQLRPFDRAHFVDVIRALEVAHAAKDSHLISQHLKGLVGCVRLLSTSSGCNVTGLVAAHVAGIIGGASDVSVVGSTGWIAKFEAEQKVSSASADLLDIPINL
jgi:chemotaxis protein histidine kinase CheA